jgi:branched-chain amino acid transport system substrate-binding protein
MDRVILLPVRGVTCDIVHDNRWLERAENRGMTMGHVSRRAILAGAAFTAGLGRAAIAQAVPLKVGLMLPFSGTYAALGENIAAGFELLIAENGGALGGRPVTLVRLDDESDPAKAPANVNRLVERDSVDVLVGTVHSGVVMALVQVARENKIPLFIPNAGNVAATRELCSPSVFRSSFSNWQPAYGMGRALAAKGVKKAAWVTWDYAAGKESGEGFRDGLRAGGAELTHTLTVPFPETNFQPVLAQIGGLGVEVVGSFFAGGGAIQFVKDYAASGLRDKIPLCGSGFLTEGVLKPQGAAAEGIQTALHYGDGLDNAKNAAFRAAFKAKTTRDADVYAVQGYDAGQMLAAGLIATKGDAAAADALAAAIVAARIDSPRGAFTLSASHNPIQTIWLREVRDGQNKVIGAAVEALADPGTGCKMAGA